MTSPGRALAGLLLAAAVSVSPALPADDDGSPPDVACGLRNDIQRLVLEDARKLMPGPLARQLHKHRRALLAGARQAGRGTAPHLQSPLQDDGTASLLAESLARISALIDAQRPMKEVAREMGVTAHLIADLSNPFLGAPGDPQAARLDERFESYVHERRSRFRVVFEGYGHPLLDEQRVEAFGRSLADRSRSYLDDLIGAFRRYDTGEDPTALDDRSVAFGVASLTYSRTVTDTARAWLHAWRQANGDLTGLPYPLEE